MSRDDIYKLLSERHFKIHKAEPTKGNKMNEPNRHAALMRQYMEELILDPKAYRNWELKPAWCYEWGDADAVHLDWLEGWDYRRKAKTITIGGIEVPDPMRVAPKVGDRYYTLNTARTALYDLFSWDDHGFDRAALKRGMCHKTKESAIAHAHAIIIASGGTVGEPK